MRKSLGALLGLVLLAGPASAQQATLVVENGRVITGDGTVLEEASVVVAGDSILSVTQQPIEAPEAQRIDASGQTVLPGLIDGHVHLIVPSSGLDSTSVARFLDDGMPEVLRALLVRGITTVRSTGDMWPEIGRLRDRVAAGEITGPRIVTAGPVFTAKGGHPASTVCKGSPYCRSRHTREVTEPEDAREAVRELANEGVDYIKLVSDTILAPVLIEDQVVEAIIDQAHREGLKTVGHVARDEDMVRYARMGMDDFVHMPREVPSRHRPKRLAEVLGKYGTPVTTTLFADFDPHGPSPQGESARRERIEVRTKHMMTLAEAGVPLVVGTDWNPSWPETSDDADLQAGRALVTEMRMLQQGGMSRRAIIQAATANAARALEMSDRVGTLEADKLADLIVVDGNPLKDLSALENIEVVVKGGEVVLPQ